VCAQFSDDAAPWWALSGHERLFRLLGCVVGSLVPV